MIKRELSEEAQILDPDKRIKLKSPRTPRNLAESNYEDGDQIMVSVTTDYPSTSRSESSDSVTFVFSDNQDRTVAGDEADVQVSQWSDVNLNKCKSETTLLEEEEREDCSLTDVTKEECSSSEGTESEIQFYSQVSLGNDKEFCVPV